MPDKREFPIYLDRNRWLSIRQFCLVYGVSYHFAHNLITRKCVTSQLFGNTYRIKDPGWQGGAEIDENKWRSVEDILLLRPGEVAELVGCSVRWITKASAKKKIKYIEIGNARTRRYSITAVRAFIADRAAGKGKKAKRTDARQAVIKLARERLAKPAPVACSAFRIEP